MTARHLDTAEYDHPTTVARTVLSLERPTAIVFDCDGVLAPLTDHADDSVLLDGVQEVLGRLGAAAETNDLTVAVLSGRSLAGLAQFDLPDAIEVLGSYGGERRGHPATPLSDEEADRLQQLDDAARTAREIAGDGAWIERKPASVVLHVRQADPDQGAAALRRLGELRRGIPGADAHEGSNVLELLARPNDKGTALRTLRQETGAATLVYLGDDIPDEDAFAVLLDGDLGVKVGDGTTIARQRLSDPVAVRSFIDELVARLGA